MHLVKRYIFNILYWLDKGGNTLTGGSPDETISRRAGRAEQRGERWGRYMCRFLNFFDKDHCAKTLKRDLGKAWRGVAPDSDEHTDLKESE